MRCLLLKWRNFSLRKRIFFSMIMVAIPTLLLLGSISYFQERKIETYSKDKFIEGSVLNTKTQLEDKVSDGNSVLTSLAFNNGIGRAFDQADEDFNLYDMYLFFKDIFDPVLGMIKNLNPEIKDILFFTNSPINTLRDNIHSLEDAKEFPFKNEVDYSMMPQWFIDNHNVYGLMVLPKTVALETKTAVVVVYDKNKFFANLKEYDEAVNFSILDGKTAAFKTKVNETKSFLYEGEIKGTEWKLKASLNKNAASGLGAINLTLAGILFSVFLAVLLTRFFTNLISTNFIRLNETIKKYTTSKETPLIFSTNQKDEFGQLSNEVGKMLIKLDEMNEQVYQAELEQQRSKYDVLVNQINSHFLYNTLSMINWQAIESGNVRISMAVQELSKFYRTSLNKGKSVTSLKNELENIRSYINLQLMLNDHFQVSYDFDPRIMEVTVINLMIQPLVENAIEHGFDSQKKDLEIFISAQKKEENQIEICVVDNGKGIPKAELDQILSKEGKGYGLRNVNQRIKFYFGEEYGLVLSSREGVGTAAKIILPSQIGEIKES